MSRIKIIAAVIAAILPFAVSCSADEPEMPQIPAYTPSGNTKTLVAYFSAQGHTKAIAEAISRATGADIFVIEAAEPYASNPYDDSNRIQNEAYNDLRPAVKTLLPPEQMDTYDTIFVGTPCWWHQPAMVVCTFLEHYNFSGKTVIPFVTFGARTYLNETMQKLFKSSADAVHIPASLPRDIDPDNIRQPQNDDDGIDMPSGASDVPSWLRRIGYGAGNSGISAVFSDTGSDSGIYSMTGTRLFAVPESGFYIRSGKKYLAR